MNKKRIIIIIVDIIAIVGMIISYNYSRKAKNEINNVDFPKKEVDEEKSWYNFKKIKYPYSTNITFAYFSNDKFKLSGDGFEAIIEILMDADNVIFGRTNQYYELLREQDLDVSKSNVTMIGGNNVIVYEYRENVNALLCYLKASVPFEYEIILYNDDDSFSIDNLTKVIDYLLQGEIVDDNNLYYSYRSISLE